MVTARERVSWASNVETLDSAGTRNLFLTDQSSLYLFVALFNLCQELLGTDTRGAEGFHFSGLFFIHLFSYLYTVFQKHPQHF